MTQTRHRHRLELRPLQSLLHYPPPPLFLNRRRHRYLLQPQNPLQLGLPPRRRSLLRPRSPRRHQRPLLQPRQLLLPCPLQHQLRHLHPFQFPQRRRPQNLLPRQQLFPQLRLRPSPPLLRHSSPRRPRPVAVSKVSLHCRAARLSTPVSARFSFSYLTQGTTGFRNLLQAAHSFSKQAQRAQVKGNWTGRWVLLSIRPEVSCMSRTQETTGYSS